MEYLTIVGAAFVIWVVIVFLFTPRIDYHGTARLDATSTRFQHVLQSTCQAALHHRNRIDILTNGEAFYPAMLDAIRQAKRSIDMECYLFHKGDIAARFIDALAERAGNGVTVTIVLDAVGSLFSSTSLWKLREAGCRVERYSGLHWYRLARLNNRTHRELLIVDGRVAFVGGAGIADQWFHGYKGRKPWRDTMARVEGPIVASLQGVFVENWLECCGEILVGNAYFPDLKVAGETTAFVVKSSPSDRATVSRVVYQLLIESAQREVCVSTPYFLPDKAFRQCLVDVAARGVQIAVVVPGPRTDQKWVRFASRRMYRELLKGGVKIHEYRGMTHCKVLIVDQLWGIVGTTNLDNRSFEHNDEVNLAMRDQTIAARLLDDFWSDVRNSDEITLRSMDLRPFWEKVISPVAWILERQQ